MTYYTEYIEKRMNSQQLDVERMEKLSRIAEIRKRDVLVFAASTKRLPMQVPRMIDHDDLLPIKDQLAKLKGSALDIVLVTEGGRAEAVEAIVRLLRGRYGDIGFIIPGRAMSAGTILAMSGDEILMSHESSLGPIDAQVSHRGNIISAQALIDGVQKIKEEVVDANNKLNAAYFPILAGVSPGDLEHCRNGLDFAKDLVTDWLHHYKFQKWVKHTSDGREVTEAEKESRASEIAEQLCDHSRWKTHDRCIKLQDLTEMRLLVTDFTAERELGEAIERYYVLLYMTFERSNIFKLYETPKSHIYRQLLPVHQQVTPVSGESADVDVQCNNCGAVIPVQVDFKKGVKHRKGMMSYPKGSVLTCPRCGQHIDLTPMRLELEKTAGKPIVV